MGYKGYKKILKNENIDNNPSFSENLQLFFDENPNIEIIHIITHRAYHITIIYQELIADYIEQQQVNGANMSDDKCTLHNVCNIEERKKVCPKCGSEDIVLIIYCNECNESM